MPHCKTLTFLVLYKELALKTELDFSYVCIVLLKKLQSGSHYYLFSEITTQYAVSNFADRQKNESGVQSNVSSFLVIILWGFLNSDVRYEFTILKERFNVASVHYSVLILSQECYSLLSLIINIDCMLVCEQLKWPSVPVSRKSTQKFSRYSFSHLLGCLMVHLSCPNQFLLQLEGDEQRR